MQTPENNNNNMGYQSYNQNYNKNPYDVNMSGEVKVIVSIYLILLSKATQRS